MCDGHGGAQVPRSGEADRLLVGAVVRFEHLHDLSHRGVGLHGVDDRRQYVVLALDGIADGRKRRLDCRIVPFRLDRLEPLELAVKEERDDAAVEAALSAVGDAIEGDDNVMAPIIDAVKAYATMGEIMQVFEAHHGAYQETVGLA